jgi:hypothetical protein
MSLLFQLVLTSEPDTTAPPTYHGATIGHSVKITHHQHGNITTCGDPFAPRPAHAVQCNNSPHCRDCRARDPAPAADEPPARTEKRLEGRVEIEDRRRRWRKPAAEKKKVSLSLEGAAVAGEGEVEGEVEGELSGRAVVRRSRARGRARVMKVAVEMGWGK